jgi:hypothetical protein
MLRERRGGRIMPPMPKRSKEVLKAFAKALCDLCGLEESADLRKTIERFPFDECPAPIHRGRDRLVLGRSAHSAMNVGFVMLAALGVRDAHHRRLLKQMADLVREKSVSSDEIALRARDIVDVYAPHARDDRWASYWRNAFVHALYTSVHDRFRAPTQEQRALIDALLAKHTIDPRKAKRGGPYTSIGIVTHLYRELELFGHPGKRSVEASQKVIASAIKRASTPLRKK